MLTKFVHRVLALLSAIPILIVTWYFAKPYVIGGAIILAVLIVAGKLLHNVKRREAEEFERLRASRHQYPLYNYDSTRGVFYPALWR